MSQEARIFPDGKDMECDYCIVNGTGKRNVDMNEEMYASYDNFTLIQSCPVGEDKQKETVPAYGFILGISGQ